MRLFSSRSLLWLVLALVACGADDEGASDSLGGDFPAGNPGSGPVVGPGGVSAGGAIGGGTAGATAPPPEIEIDVPFEAPQAGKTTVYVPNPGINKVAAVNASTFAIETLPSGLAPTYAATVPGQDVAIVLNVGSSDASILRTTDGKTSVQRLHIGHDQNAIAIAPDGLHALVYFDARLSKKLAQSFQDVSVLNLTPGKEAVRGVSVGFRPRAVQFSRDGQHAFVVTEDGISSIDLAATDSGPTIAQLISVGDKVNEAVSLDVQIVPDGSFAVARREGDPRLRLVDLSNGEIKTLSFEGLQEPPPPPPPPEAGVDAGDGAVGEAGAGDGAVSDAGVPPADAGTGDAGDAGDAGADGGARLPFGALDLTDVDLAADGSYALAVIRNAGTLLRIPLPAGFTDPSAITVVPLEVPGLGSVTVSKQGNMAALYATAVPVEALVLIDLKDPKLRQRAVRLRKAVRGVALSDDGSRALVLHQKNGQVAAGASEEQRIDASEGYSVVEVTQGIAKLQLTTAPPQEHDLLVTPDAKRVFLLLRDDQSKVRSVEMVDLSSLQVSVRTLAKPPTSLGLIPGAERVFVGQESEGGMITFLNVESGEIVHAVSGFELSGRVRQ
jgi:DNA-binding beta-propeller fold protein YncE